MMMGGFGNFGHFGGYGSFGLVGMIIHLVITIGVIIGLVLLVVWAVRRLSSGHNHYVTPPASGQTARDIAQVRYAKGEITRDEYQQILNDLGQ